MTYAQLQTDVITYMKRSDLADNVPTFIRLAESSLFREISPPETETVTVGATVDGYIELPADFGTLRKITMEQGGYIRELQYASREFEDNNATPYPSHYSLEAGKLRVYGTSTGTAYTIHYLPTMQPLSDVVTTNWLLENAADLYMYASALEGAKYTLDNEEAVKLASLVGALTDSVRRLAERRAMPSVGGLRIKPRRAV